MEQILDKFGVFLGTGLGQVRDRFETRTCLVQVPRNFGVLLGTGCDRFRTDLGQEQVWNRFQTCLGFFLGQVQERFGRGLRQV